MSVTAMEYKRFPVAEFKADGEKPGHFKALVAVFGNVDEGGDRIMPGAFDAVLAKSNTFPLVWSHNWNLPPIGKAVGEATQHGLEIDGQLLLDDKGISGEYARSVATGFKAGVLNDFSFAYEVADTAEVTENEVTIREIQSFKRVFEVGPTLVGMNDGTQLLEAASQNPQGMGVFADLIVRKLRESGAAIGYISVSAGPDFAIADKAAIASHSTSTTEGTWDGNAAMTAASHAKNPASAFRAICAWYAGTNPDQRSSYKFPHHRDPGGPAVLAGVRNGLARLSRASIPDADRSGVQRHLQRHLDDAKKALDDKPPGQGEDAEELAARIARAHRLFTALPA